MSANDRYDIEVNVLGLESAERRVDQLDQRLRALGQIQAPARGAGPEEINRFAGQVATPELASGASKLNLAQTNATRALENYIRVYTLEYADAQKEREAKLAAGARLESSQLALSRAYAEQARQLENQTKKISVQQEIYQQQGTSEQAIRNLQAERQAFTNLASTASEARRRELASPDTTTARRVQLELGGTSGSLSQELRKGFFGTRDPGDQLSFGGSIGQVGRFTALYGGAYGLLRQITNGYQAATKEVKDFQNAVADLNLASGQTTETNQALADSLGNLAAAAGIAPSQGVQAGAQAIGLYGVAGASPQEQAATAKASVAVSTRISAIGGQPLEQVQQNLAGLAHSLDISVQRLPALEDELTYVSRQIGRPVSELLPAVANVATLGKGAGFSAEELFAIIGKVTSTTGQSAGGASSSFRQVLSRADDPNFLAKVQNQFGIDTQGKTLRDIFAAFSASNPDQQKINQFSLLFGRGASQQVSQIVSGNWGGIEQLAAGSANQAGTGLGKNVFDTVNAAFAQTLKILGSSIMNLAKDLANTGILDFLGLFVKAMIPVVTTLDKLVQLFNTIPRPLRDAAFGLVELSVALKALDVFGPIVGAAAKGVVATTGGRVMSLAEAGGYTARTAAVAGGVSDVERAVAEALGISTGTLGARTASRAGAQSYGLRQFLARDFASFSAPAAALGAHQGRTLTLAEELSLGSLPGRAGGLGASAFGAIGNLPGIKQAGAAVGLEGAALGATAAGIGAAAVVAVGVIKNLVENDAVRSAITDAAIKVASARTPDEAQAALEAAKGAQARASKLTNAPLLSLQTLTGQTALNSLNVTGALDTQAQAQAQVQYAEYQKKALAAATATASATNPSAAFTDFSNLDTLTSTITSLSAAGYSASDEIRAVNEAFSRMTDAAKAGATAVLAVGNATLLGLQSGGGANVALQRIQGYAQSKIDARGLFQNSNDVRDAQGNKYSDAVSALRNVDPSLLSNQVSQVVQSSVAALPKDAQGNTIISEKAKSDIKKAAILVAEQSLPKNTSTELRKFFEATLGSQIDASLSALTGNNTGAGSLTNMLQTVFAQYSASAAHESYLSGDSAKGQATSIALLQTSIKNARAALPDASSNTSLGGKQASDSSTARAEGLRQIAQYEEQLAGFYKTYQQQADSEAKALLAYNQAALKTDDLATRDKLAVAQAQAAVAAAKKPIDGSPVDQQFLQQKQTELRQAQQQQAKDTLDAAAAGRLVGIDPRNTTAQLAAQLANAKAALASETVGSKAYSDTQVQIAQLQLQQKQNATDIANASTAANVAGDSSAINKAKAGILEAQRTLALQLPGTKDYYAALGALRQEQVSLGNAQLAYASDLRKLSTDLTDPVAQAQNAVKDAQAKLALDTRNKQGPDVIAADKVNLQNSQNQAEAAAFSQRLSDAQIADQLGRSSHQAYLKYLQSEHDRLTNITHRTRQQQDELNQIDQALKAANTQLQGQFNLGDIKVPTPYEVRRYIAAAASAATSGATAAALGATQTISSNSAAYSAPTIYINGADTAAVTALLRQILGSSAVANATTAGRKSG